MISTLVLVGLALVWAVVLLPDLLARISQGRRRDTIRTFNHQLSSLGRSTPVQQPVTGSQQGSGRLRRPPQTASNVIDLRSRRGGAGADPLAVPSGDLGGPPRRAGVSPALRKRRQDVLFSLGAAALLTLLATVAFGGVFLYVHLLADVLMAAYLVALQRVGSPRAAAAAGPQAQQAPEQLGLRVSGLGGSPVGAYAPQARRVAN